MTKEIPDDEWWVIGDIESHRYLHWKGGCTSGSFTDTSDPLDGERYATADDARDAIAGDEDVRQEISDWEVKAVPVHVKKGVIVSDYTAEREVDVADRKQRRAQLLYCMDVIMHALNDEEAAVPWLSDGVPDGTLEQDLTVEQVAPYLDLDVDDEEFDRMAGLFIRTLASEGGFRGSGSSDLKIGKAVLW